MSYQLARRPLARKGLGQALVTARSTPAEAARQAAARAAISRVSGKALGQAPRFVRTGLGQGGAVSVTAPPAGGAPKPTAKVDSSGATVVGVDPSRTAVSTTPSGWNPYISLAVLRYPQDELTALDTYDLTGTLVYPNSNLLIQSQRQMSGDCNEVLKKIFLVDLYEKARNALRSLLSYSPLPSEQKTWYDTAQAWMQIWCRATSIQGGTFQSAMSVSRLLKTPFDNEAPWPEKSDGQSLSRQISTVQLSGKATTTVQGTPYDLFGFQSAYPVPDGRENANLAWPAAGPDEQYFGMPLWATFVVDRYRSAWEKRVAQWDWACALDHRQTVLLMNCGSTSPQGANLSTGSNLRGSLTGQKVSAPSGQPGQPIDNVDLTNCGWSGDDCHGRYRDILINTFQQVRRDMGLSDDLSGYATGGGGDPTTPIPPQYRNDDHDLLWQSTSQYPVDVFVGLLDAKTAVLSTVNNYDIYYRALRDFPLNPLARIASDVGSQAAIGGRVDYWQTGTAATGWMMCNSIRARMQEMADMAFMPLLARSMQQYSAFLQLPENIALAGESAGQITAAANAAAQAGVETAAQVGEAIGAGIMVFGGIGTVIGGIVAGLSALLGFLGSLITTQAYAPPPLWYRILDHCNGQDLASAGIAAITQYIQKQQLQAQRVQSTVASQSNAYTNGILGNGETGALKTWKVAAWTGGGVLAAVVGALVARKVRGRRVAAPASVAKNRRRTSRRTSR